MTSAVRVSCGVYKMVLLTYPRDFRLRFGSEMATTFPTRSAANGNAAVCRESRECGVRTNGSAFRRGTTSTTKHNCDCDVAGTASVTCLVYTVFHAMTHVCNGE
jgi:hypothetical protein